MSSVKLPKSFVAIDLSEKEAFERRTNGNGIANGNATAAAQKKDGAESEEAADRGRSEERRASGQSGADVPPVEELPAPALSG